jgi:pyruvate dehydrogenase E1 component beta subunit
MNGGAVSVPLVIWAIINRGGEQGAQHSQAIHGLFAHVPGLKVVMPATAYDAKGLMIAAIRDPNPVIFMDDRWLYNSECAVPTEPYEVPIGRAVVRREGRDVTIAAISFMAAEAERAVDQLAAGGIEAELVDLRSAKPLDVEAVVKSVAKTGRLVVADVGWTTGGVSAELAARVSEMAFGKLKAPIRRVALPDCPAPASRTLEAAYYPRAEAIVERAEELTRWGR